MSTAPGFSPLYQQVYDLLVKQITEGKRKPGTSLPSEHVLAAEFGVSQGTMRKALNLLTFEGVIERRQGKGSFVAQYTQENLLFRFFRISRPGGSRLIPQPHQEQIRKRSAKVPECEKLDLPRESDVYEIRRSRLLEGEQCLLETIVVPRSIFPDIDKHGALPNALYTLYQQAYGIQIMSTHEELKAVLANKDEQQLLSLKAGDPVLQIDRIAFALDGRKVELRTTKCNTANLVYSVSL